MKTVVVNCRNEQFDIYIGRPQKWGNPFVIGKDGGRTEVIEKYRIWIMTQPKLVADLPSLVGKVLGCWCKPRECHGDVLVEMVNDLSNPIPPGGKT